MPWKDARAMSQKLEFIEAARKAGANISGLCREYGVTRPTAYKWLNRYEAEGFEGLEERSRRPKTPHGATAADMVLATIDYKEAHPNWGPTKLQILMQKKFGKLAPSRATIARVLERFGKVKKRKVQIRLSKPQSAPSPTIEEPNDVWTVDFKGWWRTGDGSRCEPLTVRDAFSRYVLAVRIMPGTRMSAVREQFEKLFRKHGLPKVIQCDNGTPFVSVTARGGLTRLSAWWVSLGIELVRSRLAHPEDNGGHERMHKDIAEEVEVFAAPTLRQEQRALDRWRLEFNNIRPHAALGGKTPAEVYVSSKRKKITPLRFAYPKHWEVRRVDCVGKIVVNSARYRVGRGMIRQDVALEPLDGMKHRVWFHSVELGELEITPGADTIAKIVQTHEKTFGPKSGIERRKPKTKIRAA